MVDEHIRPFRPPLNLMALKLIFEEQFSNTTLQNDEYLIIKDILVGNYLIDGWVRSSEDANNPNFKFRLNNQNSLAGTISYFVNHYGSFPKRVYITDFTTSTGELEMSSAIDGYSYINGILIVTIPGDLVFQWAQNVSDTDKIYVHKDSYLNLRSFRMAA